MDLNDLTVIIAVLGALTVGVSIITEVVKKLIKTKTEISDNVIVVTVSVLLTVFAFTMYEIKSGNQITWYNIIASIVAGFFVAYSAMFGYDKLKETLLKLKK